MRPLIFALKVQPSSSTDLRSFRRFTFTFTIILFVHTIYKLKSELWQLTHLLDTGGTNEKVLSNMILLNSVVITLLPSQFIIGYFRQSKYLPQFALRVVV